LNVFKYPQDPDADSEGSKSIQKDVAVSETLSTELGENNAKMHFVLYKPLHIIRSDGTNCMGNLTLFYPLTLEKLSKPVPINEVLFWGNQIFSGIQAIHSLGDSINDLKPANLFIDNSRNCLIADYGGVTRMNEILREYTTAYLPKELWEADSPIVTPLNDKYCLLVTLHELLCRRPDDVTFGTVEENYLLVYHPEFQELVRKILN
jgi:serine/threonine protein kinase